VHAALKKPYNPKEIMPSYGNWKSITRALYADGKVDRYSIVFLRKIDDGWYDEVRYDSHDRTRGRYQKAPHFHMKMRSAFKADTGSAEAELWDIIRKELPRIEAITGNTKVSE
jgi:hypothetical protein